LAWFSDDDYCRVGAKIESSAQSVYERAAFIVKIRAPLPGEVERMQDKATLVCLLYPQIHSDVARRLAARGITAIAMENLPRTTAAQSMDVLSSQSAAAGYRAVIAAANALPKFFPMLMTPAGTIAPARVLILGAGVAGLQAIATARRMGAVVEAFDVRGAVREEVESLGARFIAAEFSEDTQTVEGYARPLSGDSRQRAMAAIRPSIHSADICITTALIPNSRAPLLITAEMVRSMRPGSVIVDLAAEQGGNCELTEPGKDVTVHGVTIIGRFNLTSEVCVDASRMYSRNMEKVIAHFCRAGAVRIDLQDEIARACVVTHGGAIVAPALRSSLTSNDGAPT
jgi:NAD(P) transhydrogenase subunit alpha